jgi:hypothetical protein
LHGLRLITVSGPVYAAILPCYSIPELCMRDQR